MSSPGGERGGGGREEGGERGGGGRGGEGEGRRERRGGGGGRGMRALLPCPLYTVLSMSTMYHTYIISLPFSVPCRVARP